MAKRDRTKIDPKEDQFIKLVMDVYGFLTKNLLYIAISVGVVVVILGGVWMYYHLTERANINASIAIKEALEIFEDAESGWTDSEQASENAEELRRRRMDRAGMPGSPGRGES